VLAWAPVLLDQKRTKRWARVLAIFTSLAFVGGGIVLILVSAFGSPSSSSSQLISDAKSAVTATPNSVQAWDDLATAYQAANKNTDAISAATHAAKLDPSDKTSALTLAQLYTTTGQPAAAIAAVEAYTKRVPSDPDGWAQLGQLADNSGNAALAYSAYRRYLAVAPPGATPTAVRGHLPVLAKVRAAQAVTTAQPKNAAAWDALTAAYLAEQNLTGALTASVKATTLAPHNAAYMSRMASIYTSAGQAAAAAQLALGFTTRNPKIADGFYDLGRLSQAAADKKQAIAAYKKYLVLAPGGPHAAAAKAQLTKLGAS